MNSDQAMAEKKKKLRCKVALTLLAPWRHARPVPEEALRGVVPLEHVSVPALELAHHAVVQARGHHHPVLGRLGKLGALG